jgi:hypothetical protein
METVMANVPSAVKRTTGGLVDVLFQTIDKLNTKEVDAEHARAISHTARTIVSVASLELEFRKFSDGQSGSSSGLGSLTIDAPKEE